MTENRRNEPATEPQKDKLRFFGCTWDDGITAGQATDALTECAKLFPDREVAWQMQKTECPNNPETFPVETFEKPDATISEEVTIQKAEIVETKPTPAAAPAFIPPPPEPQSKIEAPPHEVPIQTAKSLSAQPSARHEGFFSGTAERRRDANLSNNQLENAASDAQDSAAIKAHYSPQTDSYTFVPIYSTSEQLNAIRAYGKQPPKGLTFTEAEKLLEQCKILHLIKLRADILRRAAIQKAETAAAQPGARHEDEETGVCSQKIQNLIAQLKNYDKHARDRAAIELGRSKNPLAVKPLISSLEDDHWGVRSHAAQALGVLGFPEAVQALIEMLLNESEVNTVRATAAEAIGKIKDAHAIAALNLALKDPSELVRKAAHEALSKIRGNAPIQPPQISAQRPSSYQPALIPSKQSMEEILKTCPLSDGCYWLPMETAAKLANIVTETKLTNGESRQIANKIEWFGYCFEPDARYGGGTYDIDQTLAVFKPFSGDQINPSTAYLGAANLLRLCVLIAAADGQIDEVELDVFRRVIETQLDLTPTDHKRLQVLEKLLVQDPSSAKKTLANVAKSIPAHKRLLIGKVLVRVAAADTVITKDERRALERIFKAFEISQDTLENLMLQACPPSQADIVKKTPPGSIPVKPETPEALEAELSREKEWDDWVALQERLAERQKRTLGEATLQKNETVETQPSVRPEGFFCGSNRRTPGDSTNYDGPATPEQLSELRSNGVETGPGLKFVEANELIESCRSQEKKASHHYKMYCPVCNGQIEVSIDTVGKKRTCDHCQAEVTPVFTRKNPRASIVRASIVQDSEPRRPAVELYEMYCPVCDGNIEVQQGTVGKRRSCPHCRSNITPVFIRNNPRKKTAPTRVAQDSFPLHREDVSPRQKADDAPGYYSRVTPEQLDELRSFGENPTNALVYYGAAKIWIENCKNRKGFGIPRNTRPEVARGSAVSERISTPVAPPASKQFALDMAKVHFITNETREVVGILSVLMEDESEILVASPQRVEVSAPEIPQVSGGDKSAPQPSRFGGLNAVFIPILERLLTRDSWPLTDFNAIAREFQFMPLNISDTLNEWSDEALGDFILDGEDPVFVRRELIAKEKI